jgi:hypothetical protein
MDGMQVVRAKIAQNVALHGRCVMSTVTEDGVPYSYTIGNALKHLPELLLFGFAPDDSRQLLNQWSALMIDRAGEYADGEKIDIGARFPCLARHCTPEALDLTLQVEGFLGHRDYRVTQIVSPDSKGRFPGDPLCEPPYALMPVYARREGNRDR